MVCVPIYYSLFFGLTMRMYSACLELCFGVILISFHNLVYGILVVYSMCVCECVCFAVNGWHIYENCNSDHGRINMLDAYILILIVGCIKNIFINTNTYNKYIHEFKIISIYNCTKSYLYIVISQMHNFWLPQLYLEYNIWLWFYSTPETPFGAPRWWIPWACSWWLIR